MYHIRSTRFAGLRRYTAAIAAATATAAIWNAVPARADGSRAWTAARRSAPEDAEVVLGVDLAALQRTQLLPALYDYTIRQATGEEYQMIETLQDICKLDLRTAVAGFVAVGNRQGGGAAYLSLSPGVDEAKLATCLHRLVKSLADSATRFSLTYDGHIMQVSSNVEDTYFGWIDQDVVVGAFHGTDRKMLAHWMGGNGAFAASRLGKLVEKVNTAATVWFAVEPSTHTRDGSTIGRLYGAFTFADGHVDGTAHRSVEDALHAAKEAAEIRGRLEEARRNMRLVPKLADVVKAITISSVGNEVIIETRFIESDLVTVLPLFAMISKLLQNK